MVILPNPFGMHPVSIEEIQRLSGGCGSHVERTESAPDFWGPGRQLDPGSGPSPHCYQLLDRSAAFGLTSTTSGYRNPVSGPH